MSKLFKLKSWLTLDDAASYLSSVLQENVTPADIVQLALDRKIKLSVNIVNLTYANKGTTSIHSDEEIEAAIATGNLIEGLDWSSMPKDLDAFFLNLKSSSGEIEKSVEMETLLMSLNIGNDRYVTFEDSITRLN